MALLKSDSEIEPCVDTCREGFPIERVEYVVLTLQYPRTFVKQKHGLCATWPDSNGC